MPYIHTQLIIKYIPLQQGLRLPSSETDATRVTIIKYIPLQQGLRLTYGKVITLKVIHY